MGKSFVCGSSSSCDDNSFPSVSLCTAYFTVVNDGKIKTFYKTLSGPVSLRIRSSKQSVSQFSLTSTSRLNPKGKNFDLGYDITKVD